MATIFNMTGVRWHVDSTKRIDSYTEAEGDDDNFDSTYTLGDLSQFAAEAERLYIEASRVWDEIPASQIVILAPLGVAKEQISTLRAAMARLTDSPVVILWQDVSDSKEV